MRTVHKYPVLGAMVALALSACAPDTSRWSPAEAPKENKVTFMRLAHSVMFRPGEERLSPAESERLAMFLARERVGYGDEIALIGADTVLARRQKSAVAAMFAGAGLSVTRDAQIEGVTTAPGEVRVVVGRHIVTPPPCPNWSKAPTEDFTNRVSSNFGCATAHNLGLMVADPGDLVAGRTPGPADGEVSAFSIEKYRRGQITPLLRGDVSPNERADVVKEAK